MGWVGMSFTSVVFLVPAWLAITFFKRNFGVTPETTLVYYLVGVILAGVSGMVPLQQPSWGVGIAILTVGVVFGAPSNFLLYRAITLAPTEALPIAIVEGAALFVYLASLLLGHLLPKYFAQAVFHPRQLIGILLMVLGALMLISHSK